MPSSGTCPGGRSRSWPGNATGHGREESCTLKAVTVTAGLAFPHAAQAICIIRRTRPLASRTWRTVTVYAVTSLAVTQASASQLAEWIRGHSRIENQLHWVRSHLQRGRLPGPHGTGPRVMATLRNLVIAIMELAGAGNIAATCRHHADRRRQNTSHPRAHPAMTKTDTTPLCRGPDRPGTRRANAVGPPC